MLHPYNSSTPGDFFGNSNDSYDGNANNYGDANENITHS